MPLHARRALVCFVLLPVLAGAAHGQSAPGWIPQQSDRPQWPASEESGFVSIFDGQTLEGWEGDPTYWRVEEGALVGEVTPETLLRSNTFVMWQGGEPADFELKLEYRISAGGNSGINYRSVVVPDDVTPANRYAMRGYQCDLDGANHYTGNNYEEKGRLFLAVRGQVTRVTGLQPPLILSTHATEEASQSVATPGWNEVHIIARGNLLIHIINGRLMSAVIDDDAAHRPERGRIGVQVHVGPPMKVEYRRIRLNVQR